MQNIWVFLYIYRLRLCRRPLFLLSRLYLIWVLGWFGMRHWIRGTIWVRIACFRSRFAWFWDFSVFVILLMVSDALVLHFDTKFRFLLCFEAAKKTRNAKPFNMVVEFRIDLLRGPDLWQKRCHASFIALSSLPLGARGSQGSCFHWSSLVFIDFSRVWGYLGPEGWPACGALWRPVASSGGFVIPLLECCNQ